LAEIFRRRFANCNHADSQRASAQAITPNPTNVTANTLHPAVSCTASKASVPCRWAVSDKYNDLPMLPTTAHPTAPPTSNQRNPA
jgi:hypothetical protein